MRTSSGVALIRVNAAPWRISIGSSNGLAKSNKWSKLASVSCKTWSANETPGHILLPLLNGINSKFCPLTSTCLWVVRNRSNGSLWVVGNLSGLNSNGSCQICGSVWIFHRFRIRRVTLETWWPKCFTACLMASSLYFFQLLKFQYHDRTNWDKNDNIWIQNSQLWKKLFIIRNF